MNTVLIPAFNRPEFLQLCLEHIQEAEGAQDLHYIFQLDRGHDPENVRIASTLPFSKELRYTPKTHYSLAKQSFSLLSGWIYAAHKSARLVYLIEDDVLIGRDFFRWHQEVHDQHDLFSSHANKNVNRHIEQQGSWDEYYLTTFDYGSIGTCMRREVILEQIAPHANQNYYRAPIHYCATKFRGCPLNRDQAEQDGLIRRIQWQSGGPQAYPHTEEIDGMLYGPRCYHAGYYGKNRGAGPNSSFQQKLARLREIVYSDAAMRNFASQPDFYLDSRPCALALPEWKSLRLKPLTTSGSSSAA